MDTDLTNVAENRVFPSSIRAAANFDDAITGR